ncbi:hypothetical protein [uncultured Prochlorococcus sp.]|uniref:hypothetical protein n=1 Tax=uncultured Prochlorococcus sp. TaxID=159733 RepID=UPI002586BC1B|nr:hypothetical protein [uncultured Prochlorococcus sp.]
MKTSVKIPPYHIIDSTKEVIFYMPKKSGAAQEISVWVKALNLTDYRGMVINSKCMFNRLKDKQCD